TCRKVRGVAISRQSGSAPRPALLPSLRAWPLAPQPIADTADGFPQCLKARRIGKTEMALAEGTEAGAGNGGDSGLIQKPRLQGSGIEAGVPDVGECIEGTAGACTPETRKRVQR